VSRRPAAAGCSPSSGNGIAAGTSCSATPSGTLDHHGDELPLECPLDPAEHPPGAERERETSIQAALLVAVGACLERRRGWRSVAEYGARPGRATSWRRWCSARIRETAVRFRGHTLHRPGRIAGRAPVPGFRAGGLGSTGPNSRSGQSSPINPSGVVVDESRRSAARAKTRGRARVPTEATGRRARDADGLARRHKRDRL
jgi:hypothetical protein